MSDSEEDYMSDKFLLECAQKDVRPGLLFKSSQKRAMEIYKNEQEILKKPKPQEQEQERREEGLNTALSTDNKGFKMLEKMGYTPGTGLGKSSVGIKEPVAITIKSNSSGLGRDEHLKDIKKTKVHLKEKRLQACETEFRASRTEKLYAIHLRSDICKAQRTCENLDMKEGIEYPEYPHFWQRSTIAALKEKAKKKMTDLDSEDEDSSSSGSDTEDDYDEELLLQEIITHLRTRYKYCMYCGDFIEDEAECPGYFRIDHD